VVNLRRDRHEDRFADKASDNPIALGCSQCDYLSLCGGLHNAAGAFYCLDYCCNKPEACDVVCPRNRSSFVDRIREIGGFGLTCSGDVPRYTISLPPLVPIIYNGVSRTAIFNAEAVALPLYQLVHRQGGMLKYADRDALCSAFRISKDSAIFLSGTKEDGPLERWWSLGDGRKELVHKLVEFGFVGASGPNYSVFSDQPRWDDMHSMKRIVITWEEMNQIGLPTALHPNARTETDWDRWRAFVRETPAVTSLAFEFGTGAGRATRIRWHANQLCDVAESAGRRLSLFVRGGSSVLQQLRKHFEVTVLDTAIFVKTHKRKKARAGKEGRIFWDKVPNRGACLDDLIQHNYAEVGRSLRVRFNSAA
jgi:hypothetical protein